MKVLYLYLIIFFIGAQLNVVCVSAMNNDESEKKVTLYALEKYKMPETKEGSIDGLVDYSKLTSLGLCTCYFPLEIECGLLLFPFEKGVFQVANENVEAYKICKQIDGRGVYWNRENKEKKTIIIQWLDMQGNIQFITPSDDRRFENYVANVDKTRAELKKIEELEKQKNLLSTSKIKYVLHEYTAFLKKGADCAFISSYYNHKREKSYCDNEDVTIDNNFTGILSFYVKNDKPTGNWQLIPHTHLFCCGPRESGVPVMNMLDVDTGKWTIFLCEKSDNKSEQEIDKKVNSENNEVQLMSDNNSVIKTNEEVKIVSSHQDVPSTPKVSNDKPVISTKNGLVTASIVAITVAMLVYRKSIKTFFQQFHLPIFS